MKKNTKVKTSNRRVLHQLREQSINKNSSTEVSHTINKIKEKELEITILWVVLFLILLCVSLYITFTSVQKFEKHNTLKNGTLVTEYKDIASGMGDIITFTGYGDTTIYNFTVTNSSKNESTYSIVLKDDNDMVELDGCSEKLLSKDNISVSINGSKYKKLTKYIVDDKIIIKSGKLKALEEKKYELCFKENNKTGLHYHGKIVIEK